MGSVYSFRDMLRLSPVHEVTPAPLTKDLETRYNTGNRKIDLKKG
jgi:hypothetical protein